MCLECTKIIRIRFKSKLLWKETRNKYEKERGQQRKAETETDRDREKERRRESLDILQHKETRLWEQERRNERYGQYR